MGDTLYILSFALNVFMAICCLFLSLELEKAEAKIKEFQKEKLQGKFEKIEKKLEEKAAQNGKQ